MLAIPRQRSHASLSSSGPSSLRSSLFPPESLASTAPSSFASQPSAPSPSTTPRQSELLAKDKSIHLPLSLPGPGRQLDEVDLRRLTLDAEFDGAPVGFVLAKLRKIGPALLKTTTATTFHIPSSPSLPQHVACSFPTSASDSRLPASEQALLPSHLLAIRAPDSTRTLLLPIHGLLWAAASPSLARLSSRGEGQAPAVGSESSLPVVHINLPSSLAVPIVQGWVYLRSKEALLSALLPKPPVEQGSISPLLNPTAATLTSSLSHLSSAKLLQHIELLHSLWSIVCALSISDTELWAVMGFAWGVVAGALVLNEKRRVEVEEHAASTLAAMSMQ